MIRLPLRTRIVAEQLRAVSVALIRNNQPDLTARQLAIFLSCYLEPEPQRLSKIAKTLNIDPAAVTRGVDRLEQFNLAKRVRDPYDRRGFLVGHTSRGADWLREISWLMLSQRLPHGPDVAKHLRRIRPPSGSGAHVAGKPKPPAIIPPIRDAGPRPDGPISPSVR